MIIGDQFHELSFHFLSSISLLIKLFVLNDKKNHINSKQTLIEIYLLTFFINVEILLSNFHINKNIN